MGQVRSLDEQMNAAGYLRLTTCEPLVKHLGNRLETGNGQDYRVQTRGKQFFNLPLIKKVLLRIYDAIFRLYHT